MSDKTILKFQNLKQLTIVKRPSKKIKSPYVADAVDKNNIKYLVHTPGLGLADQCVSGSEIFATRSKNKNSKTDYITQSVCVDEDGYGQTIIGANPHTAELIVKEIIQKDVWNPYPNYKICKKKPAHIDYLGDIYLKFHNKFIVIEIKNVICASFDPGKKKVERRYVFYDKKKPFYRSGIYPNGEKSQKYKGKSVVSKRSIRQIDNMINDNQNFHFAIVFLVNRGDCSNFKPNWQKDPIYSKRLTEALKSGVDIYALGVSWDDKTCKFNGQLNVDLKPW